MSPFGKFTNSLFSRFDIGRAINAKESKFISGKQDVSCDVIAKFLDLRVRKQPAHTCRAEPKVRKFMN